MEKQGNFTGTEKPVLRHPCLVVGIGGWVDGGDAATGSLRYLVRKLKAKKLAEIPIDRFHIYQVPGQLSLRPEIKIEDGLLKEHRYPANEFFYYVNPGADHDLILFLGTEPNLNWKEYAGAILSVYEEFGADRIYLLGGVLDKTPHTREPGVSCACSSELLRDEMLKYGMVPSDYQGPGRFGTTLLYICQKKGVPLASLTARATYYPEFNIIIPHNPKSIRAVVARLNSLLQLNLDLADLDRESEEFEAKISFMASQNAEFQAYVEQLEKDYVEIKYEEPLDLSEKEAVQLAEEFLKEKREE